MLVVLAAKIWNMLPLLMACLMAVAAVLCLMHPATPDQDHATHPGHAHSSSAPITRDLHCLAAILPAVVLLVWLCRDTLYLMDLWSYLVAPSFPPFIPPKAIAPA